jgi:hypothetical protein
VGSNTLFIVYYITVQFLYTYARNLFLLSVPMSCEVLSG